MEIRPIARNSEIVVQEVAGETLVYDLKTHRAKCLNETSAIVWKLCDGSRNPIEISMAMSAQLKVNVDENYVLLALDQLNKEDLLELDGQAAIEFSGVSRRDVIKKIGFAAVIALPLVSSVVAPTAAHAQSTQTCSSGSTLFDCECGGAGGNGTPSCVDAFASALWTSTRTGNIGGTCTTQDVSCVNQSSGKCMSNIPNRDKCCIVLTATQCTGPGGNCCVQ